MIAKTLFSVLIGPEAFVLAVVIAINLLSMPVLVAFDTEMVVGLYRQIARTTPRFQQTLRQGNACGNAIFLHLANGDIPVLADIILL